MMKIEIVTSAVSWQRARIGLCTFVAIAGSIGIAAAQTSPAEADAPIQPTVAKAATAPKPDDYDDTHPGGRDIEDLNLRGAYLQLPAFSDSLFGEGKKGNPVRHYLAEKGIGLYRFGDTTFQYNMLNPPVPADDQLYNGQRPTWKSSTYLFASWDMRQLGIKGGQLYAIGAIQKISWNPGGPNAIQIGALAYYQSLFKNKLELKGGYIDNDFEFIGTAIGGQASSGSLGVFASLPFEVGMSYLPLTSPGINTNYHINKDLYVKVGFQRSLSPTGGVTTANRDATGLRFAPKGDGLLTIYEGGYKHAATKDSKEMWIRSGFLYNTTHFANAKTGGVSTNKLAFLLADRQLWQPDSSKPYRGLYLGMTGMYAPPQQNAYTQYYEARMYWIAPFAKLPNDILSVVASHTDYSEYSTRNYKLRGIDAANSSTSLTGSYNTRLYRGLYFSPGLSWTQGPAIAPRQKSSLNILAQFNIFL